MLYLIYGNQYTQLKTRVKVIIKNQLPEKDDMNFVKFDAGNVSIQEIVSEANYMPLGYDHKIVVADGCYFLKKEKERNKLENEQDYECLKEYIKNPDPNVDLILLVESSELDKKNPIYSLCEQYGTIVPVLEPKANEWVEVVKTYCKDRLKIKIDIDALNELADRTAGDYALLFNTGAKLALYTDHIHYDDVKLMVARPLEDNTFLMFNHLINRQVAEAISLFRDLKSNNVEPVTLIGMLSNQFRLLDEVSYLSRSGVSAEEIANELKINPIRAKILKKNCYSLSSKKIHQTLNSLYKLDLQIKSGQVDRYYAFELFLINFNN